MPAVPAGGNAQLLPCVAVPASVIQFSRYVGFPYLPRNRGNACGLKGFFTSPQRRIVLKVNKTAVGKRPAVFAEKLDRLPRLLYVFNLVKGNFAVPGFQSGDKRHSRGRAVMEHTTRIVKHGPKILFHGFFHPFPNYSPRRGCCPLRCLYYTIAYAICKYLNLSIF